MKLGECAHVQAQDAKRHGNDADAHKHFLPAVERRRRVDEDAVGHGAAYDHRKAVHRVPDGHADYLLRACVKAAGQEDEAGVDGCLKKAQEKAHSEKRAVAQRSRMACEYRAPDDYHQRDVWAEREFLQGDGVERRAGEVAEVENTAQP